MVLFRIFNWTFQLIPSFTSATPQMLIQKSKGTAWFYSPMVDTFLLVVGVVLILFIFCIYAFASEARKCRGTFATPESPVLTNGRKRQIKRRKGKKSGKQRLTKAQKLLEVNKKWFAMYYSENSACEEQEDITTVPFGSLEITEAKKVSFRDSLQDVYFIESKEEMKHLEKLQSMGYDVTITRSRDHACEKATKTALCEEKETAVLTPALNPTLDTSIYEREESDSSPRVLKKWLNTSSFQTEENKIFKDEERLISDISLPLLTESSV